MAVLDYWIQLENRPWDASPNDIDRMTGQDIEQATGKAPAEVTIKSPGTGTIKTRRMYNPLRDGDGNVKDALILRRYLPPTKPDQSDSWTVPDDRKVNPWDLNEPDPTDDGTMGSIPGPVLECNVGDTIVVHFRNLDLRSKRGFAIRQVCFPSLDPNTGQICVNMPVSTDDPIAIEKRTHSLHPHGFVFRRFSDGAYPLAPPDTSQPITPSEAGAWASVPGFSGSFKRGDRVPPGGTFTYRWDTFGWQTTAGVWLYHDHSICDMENVELGAIGIIVIHNPADTEQEVDIRLPSDPMKLDPNFLPNGSPNGHPIDLECFPVPDVEILQIDLAGLPTPHIENMPILEAHVTHDANVTDSNPHNPSSIKHKNSHAPVPERLVKRGDLFLELDSKFKMVKRFCISRYDTPPSKALYLQLFHTFNGVSGMIINGRTFMGNTPTVIAGPDTRMRFGVVGMGSDVHTFHIHGHRWVIPGPDGNTPGSIQVSAQVKSVSQFEDTRVFGAANSFVFTIDGKSGSFMRAGGPSSDDSLGEWHMHCHVLSHMMSGMMGTLLIIKGGEIAMGLPVGVHCEHDMDMGGGGVMPQPPTMHTVNLHSSAFVPMNMIISKGDQVQFVNHDGFTHTVDWDTAGAPSNSGVISALGSAGSKYTTPPMNTTGTFAFHCLFHGAPGSGMHGSIKVNP